MYNNYEESTNYINNKYFRVKVITFPFMYSLFNGILYYSHSQFNHDTLRINKYSNKYKLPFILPLYLGMDDHNELEFNMFSKYLYNEFKNFFKNECNTLM